MVRPSMLAVLFAAAATAAQAGTLEVELDDVWPARPVQVQLFSDAQGWRAGHAYAHRVVVPRRQGEVVTFEGLPPGRYAVRAEQAGPDDPLAGRVVPSRHGVSGTQFGRRVAFDAAAIPVVDDPRVAVRLVPAN